MGQNKDQKIEDIIKFLWMKILSLSISTIVTKPLVYEVNLYVKSYVKYILCLRRQLIWNPQIMILFKKGI